ncbi:MAG: Fic family protein [Flavobacteriaceae bacterium]|nr:Fic family protein [Flavobacteriaceae bacterium]
MQNFKAGTYINQGTYKAFVPNSINKDWLISDMQIIHLLSQADRELGRLDMFSEYVDIELYIRMHIIKEATQSSKIEGTQTNMEEAFMPKEDIKAEKRDDWEEVQNYIEAMNEAVRQLHRLPFSNRLIKLTHKILLKGVRGKHKLPGEFRTSQNWIGGASIADAVFIPPPHTAIANLMSDIEKFANSLDNKLPDLLKIAIIHYQFETIHPFLDGNGRVGRLMITLYLVNKGILKQPFLYLSDFFEKHRTLYYDNLMRVRTHNNLAQWLKFFLTGIIQTTKKGVETFNGILQLQKEIAIKLKTLKSREGNARRLIDFAYKQPVFNAKAIENELQISGASVYKLLRDLERLEIITEFTGAKRGKIFIFKTYMDLFRSDD